MLLVGTHTDLPFREGTSFRSAVIGAWDRWSLHANTNILIPYLKGKIKLNVLKENYVSFMSNNHIFCVTFILKMPKKG